MSSPSTVDEQRFRKLLSRNISLPLGVGVLSAVFFVSLITYLLSVIQWVLADSAADDSVVITGGRHYRGGFTALAQ